MNNNYDLEIRAAAAEALVDAILIYLKKQTDSESLNFVLKLREDYERAANLLIGKEHE